MHIYIVRHGQSQSNAQKTVTGDMDVPLTQMGVHQAKLAGESAKNLNIGLIVASPLSRARKTAEIIAKEIGYPQDKIEIMDELAERSLGDLEGKSYAENEHLNGNYPETETYAHIETLEHLHGRVNHALRKLIKQAKGRNVLVVCHMNIGRMLLVIKNRQAAAEIYNQPRLENAQIYPLTEI